LLKYNIGDTVWYAKCRQEQVQIPCPTCFGKKQVELILGNGDSVVLPCDGCGWGFDGPRGFISEYQFLVEAELVVISGIESSICSEGEKNRYHGLHGYIYDEKDLYPTKEEAEQRSVEKKAEYDKEYSEQAEYIKKNVHKKFAWNARYHLTQAKKAREDAEYHDKMAQLCKNRARKE
jgi:hypothetical protein